MTQLEPHRQQQWYLIKRFHWLSQVAQFVGILWLGWSSVAFAAAGATPQPETKPSPALPQDSNQPLYETREIHDRNGIGKFYMGREIAWVMGHQAADWLERPEREAEENTSKLVALLAVKPGDVVADIGAGTGYLSRKLAPLAGPKGKVLAVDIQPEMLDILKTNLASIQITNVVPVLGTESDPRLPASSVDLIVMVDVYHEFSFPYEMTQAMCRALKPGGRLAFVEFRKEDPSVAIKLVHKMSEDQVKKEMSVHPLEWINTFKELPQQHLIVFRKK